MTAQRVFHYVRRSKCYCEPHPASAGFFFCLGRFRRPQADHHHTHQYQGRARDLQRRHHFFQPQPAEGDRGYRAEGRIESDNPISLSRPRDACAPDFNDVRRCLTQKLTSHVARREVRVAALRKAKLGQFIAGAVDQPKVNEKASTPESRNSISTCRAAMGFGCRIS